MRKTPNVQLFVAELLWAGQEPVLHDSLHLRADNRHIMWQKERLINLLCERLPAEFKCVAWIDGDIIFKDPNWANKALSAMRHCDIIQPWHRADLLGAAGNTESSVDAICLPNGMHPGYAWVARREVFPLYDACVIGSADALMAQAWGLHCHQDRPSFFLKRNPWSDHSARWAERHCSWRLGNLKGIINHLWHGRWQDRCYRQRLERLAALDFDPDNDLELHDGIWKWKRRECAALLKSYFARRRED